MKHIAVLNIKHKVNRKRHGVYIGRANSYYKQGASPLANPYKADPKQPGATLPAYKNHLWKQIKAGNEEVLQALRQVYEVGAVFCYCDNRNHCHGSIVEAAANWLHEQEAPEQKPKQLARREAPTNEDIQHTYAMIRDILHRAINGNLEVERAEEAIASNLMVLAGYREAIYEIEEAKTEAATVEAIAEWLRTIEEEE